MTNTGIHHYSSAYIDIINTNSRDVPYLQCITSPDCRWRSQPSALQQRLHFESSQPPLDLQEETKKKKAQNHKFYCGKTDICNLVRNKRKVKQKRMLHKREGSTPIHHWQGETLIMAETEWCSRCRCFLRVPPYAKTIKCSICGTVIRVQPKDPVWRTKNWVKGIIAQFSNTVYPPAPSSSFQCSGMPLYYGGPSVPRPANTPEHSKKRALLVGIRYMGKSYELKGSVNDVKYMKYLLLKLGFPDNCIVVLTEEERDSSRLPTRNNMLSAMKQLVHESRPGDSLVFHFSGHGSQQIDTNGDERDGFDETLCPLDYEINGMIVDDEINDIMVRPLIVGVKLHAIIDACHSGTALDLPFLCKIDRMGYCHWEDHRPTNGIEKGTRGGLAISFSGCDDNQTSADTYALARGTATGAMTYAFIQAVESEFAPTYGGLLLSMRTAIRDANAGFLASGPIASLIKKVFQFGLTQEPQLCSSEMFDVYRKPFLL